MCCGYGSVCFRLSGYSAVERAVLQRFGKVLGLDYRVARQIGDRTRYTQYAVVRTGSQTEPLKRGGKHGLRILG